MRPLNHDFEEYALDGKGSDEIWEEYIQSKRDEKDPALAKMLKPYLESPSKASKVSPLKFAMESAGEPAPTSRNLLGDDESPAGHVPTPLRLDN